jgi:hypothetical protein
MKKGVGKGKKGTYMKFIQDCFGKEGRGKMNRTVEVLYG